MAEVLTQYFCYYAVEVNKTNYNIRKFLQVVETQGVENKERRNEYAKSRNRIPQTFG